MLKDLYQRRADWCSRVINFDDGVIVDVVGVVVFVLTGHVILGQLNLNDTELD